MKDPLWKYINKDKAGLYHLAWESCQLRNANKHGHHDTYLEMSGLMVLLTKDNAFTEF